MWPFGRAYGQLREERNNYMRQSGALAGQLAREKGKCRRWRDKYVGLKKGDRDDRD